MDENSCNLTNPFAVALFCICVNNRPMEEIRKEMEPNEYINDRCEISTCSQTQHFYCYDAPNDESKGGRIHLFISKLLLFQTHFKIYLYINVCICVYGIFENFIKFSFDTIKP